MTTDTPIPQGPGTPGASAPRLAECEAFGPDGALRDTVLASPVAGRRLGPRGETETSLGGALAARETLLVFLRHFG